MKLPDSKNDIWFRAETRTYILFFGLLSSLTLLLFMTEGSAVNLMIIKSLATFALVFLCVILVSQFGSLVLRPSFVDSTGKAVFVTGCSSGFGKELVKRLDSLGFTVFAGVRSLKGDDRVSELVSHCSKRLSLVKIDVTDDKQVKEAALFVKKNLGKNKLWSIVCNAGVYSCQGFDWGHEGIAEYERIMNCNTFGSVRVVKAFLPILKMTQDSRIVINSSISSTIACPILAAYSMSKHALKAFANSLRLEVKPFRVYVSQIQPVYYCTPLVEKDKIRKQLDSFWSDTPEEVKVTYSEKHRRLITEVMDASLDMSRTDVQEVVDALTEAVLTSREPDHVVTVASYLEKSAFALSWFFPSETFDRFSFGRQAIMSMNILGSGHRFTGRVYAGMKRMFGLLFPTSTLVANLEKTE